MSKKKKSSKYNTNKYHVLMFDDFGSYLKTKIIKDGNYLKSLSVGSKFLLKNPGYSFVIIRVLYNSKNLENKWDYMV